MKEKTLVLLAAGAGSRFGGMKQIEPVGPNGEFISDYTIYSAIKYGFTRVVFVIKEETLDLFKNSIGKRLEGKIEVYYAYQKLEDVLEGITIPEGRTKPWGTAHAIYCAREYLTEKFAVATADDFYGDDAIKEIAQYLDNNDNHVIVGYNIGDTLSDNGAVKRGVILNENGLIKKIIESSCSKEKDKALCTPLDHAIEPFEVPLNQPVSMLLNGFNKSIIDTIGSYMKSEFESHKDNLLDYEMLLPDILDKEIAKGSKIEVVPTKSIWMGMTYREDCENLKRFIKKEIEEEIYPNNLWN